MHASSKGSDWNGSQKASTEAVAGVASEARRAPYATSASTTVHTNGPVRPWSVSCATTSARPRKTSMQALTSSATPLRAFTVRPEVRSDDATRPNARAAPS
jgi:hypothetical protein